MSKNKVLLDLGCGSRKQPGHIGIDSVKFECVDIVHNIEDGLPFENNTVDGVYSNFFFEHIPDTIFLFQEIYRVCRNGSLVEFRVPYYQSVTQYKDPTHKAIIVPEMISYFGKNNWYGLLDYNINTDFKLLDVQYHYMPPFYLLKSKKLLFLWPISYPILLFARRFLWNVVHSITIRLQVIK